MKASPAGILYGHKESNTGRTWGKQFFSGYGRSFLMELIHVEWRSDSSAVEKTFVLVLGIPL